MENKYIDYFKREKASRISVAQFNALPFDEMEKRIEQRLREITMRFNSKNFNYGSAYANVIRALLDGVKNGASSTEQLAVITNAAIEDGGNAITYLSMAFNWPDYLIAQFILYRAGIIGNDLIKLIEIYDHHGRTVLWTAAIAGPDLLDLLLTHPMFKGPENEEILAKFITTPDQNGMTILHYVAYMTVNLDVVKKLIGKLLRKVDFNTLHTFIHAPVEEKIWGHPLNNMTAAQIAREWAYPKLQLAEFLENFDETRLTYETKARKTPKRCAELYKKREEEENKLRYTKERITQFLEKMKVARAKLHAVGDDYGHE